MYAHAFRSTYVYTSISAFRFISMCIDVCGDMTETEKERERGREGESEREREKHR